MFKKNLIIIRHARSMNNIGATDDLDCGITEFGSKQARNVGRFLKEKTPVDTDWEFNTSPFLRCIQTSSCINDSLNCESIQFKVNLGLREYLNHSLETHADSHIHVKSREKGFNDNNFDWSQYPEGVDFKSEFNEAFMKRMQDCYHNLADNSVVVTHGLPALVLKYLATTPSPTGVPIWDYSIDNCSITWIKNGRVIWYGKNLYHELADQPWPIDNCMDSSL